MTDERKTLWLQAYEASGGSRRAANRAASPHLADGSDQFIDPAVDILGEPGQMRLLAVIAGDFVIASVDGDFNLGHDQPSSGQVKSKVVGSSLKTRLWSQ